MHGYRSSACENIEAVSIAGFVFRTLYDSLGGLMQRYNYSALPVATIQLRHLRRFVLNQPAPFTVVRRSSMDLEAEDLPSTFG